MGRKARTGGQLRIAFTQTHTTHTNTHTDTHTHTHTDTDTQTHTHRHTQKQTHTHTQAGRCQSFGARCFKLHTERPLLGKKLSFSQKQQQAARCLHNAVAVAAAAAAAAAAAVFAGRGLTFEDAEVTRWEKHTCQATIV